MTATHAEAGTVIREPAQVTTFGRSVTSEWIKLRTVRSTWYLLAVVVVSIVALALVGAIGAVVGGQPTADSRTDPLRSALPGIGVAQQAALAIGILAVTSEYATGTVKVALTVTPRRVRWALAKTVAVIACVTITSAATTAVAFVVNTVVLAAGPVDPPPVDVHVVRALIGACLYLALVAVVGVATGLLLRTSAAAASVAVAVLYLPALLVLLLPGSARTVASSLTPANAGAALMQVGPSDLLPWGAGLGVLLTYVTVLLAGGIRRLVRRDA